MKKNFTKKSRMNKILLYFCTRKWDGSSVGLERMLDRHEVTSSILVRPTQCRDVISWRLYDKTEGR